MKTLRTRLKIPASPERAFFYFLTAIFTGLFIQAVITNPTMRQPIRLLALTLLLIVHILLHWQIGWLEERPNWISIYIIGQGLMALAISLFAGTLGMVCGLFLALIGEAVGLFTQKPRGMFIAIGYFILLSFMSYGFVYGWNTAQWWALAVFPMGAFVYIYVTLYNRQILARQQAQSLLVELEAANKQLTEYAARVEDLTIAAERQRMARELHDTLSQGLAGLILQLEAVDAHLSSGRSERALAIVKQAMLQARQTLADARSAIDDLRSASSSPDKPGGLEGMVRQESERFTAATGLPCTLEINLPAGLPEAVSETVQRAVQEGLANIARHANASRASLRLAVEQDRLVVEVGDDGCGFDPQPAEGQAGHYGLMGMRERARLVGGTLLVTSAPGQGSRVTLSLPLRAKG